jgi:membrane protein implicated in regulation of membrane protease activity
VNRKVWTHRIATMICVTLAIPGVIWWRESILFVILVSLATQAYTSWGAAEAADDRTLAEQQDRIEAKLDTLIERRHRGI